MASTSASGTCWAGSSTPTASTRDAVFDEIDGGGPLDVVRKEHEAAVAESNVWGVPTFVQGDRAVFVRLMNSPTDDADGHATDRPGARPAGLDRPERVQAHLDTEVNRGRR